MTDTRRKSAGDISGGGGGGDGGSSSISSEGEDEADAIRSSNRPKKDSNSSSNKRLIRKLSSHLLDSNGESESDEEISKLQRVIKEQTKELNEERQASKKLKLLVKLLKRETKQLQKEIKGTKQQQDPSSTTGDHPGGSDSDSPPWERRKLDSCLAEAESVIREKNTHIEQLLRDCRELEAEKQQCVSQLQNLSHQFDDCTQQLQLATHNYSVLEETYKDRVTHLETENERIRIQLDDCQWQKERNEENLDKISDAVDFTINKCKEIIIGKEQSIAELQVKLQHYRSMGTPNKEEEITRLRAELAAASKEMEESARLLEQFQGLHLNSEEKGPVTDSVKRKLQKLETLKDSKKENERLLAEREEQVAELMRTIKRYESGTYGLNEATKELRETRHQLKVRDDHIEQLVQQLNALEARLEDLDLENSDLKEKFQVGSNQSVDPSSRRTLLLQKFDLCKGEIEQLKEENIKLGLENRSLKRALLKVEEKTTTKESSEDPIKPTSPIKKQKSVTTTSATLVEEYQKVCSEVIVLRKGLMEILQSVREQDGNSDVRIESPILERLVAVLNSENLFGHRDKLVEQVNSVSGENKMLKETIRELKEQCDSKSERSDQGVQAVRPLVDSANDPGDFPLFEDRWDKEVAVHQEKVDNVEQELNRVKRQLDYLSENYDAKKIEWSQKEVGFMNQLELKDNRLEELEQELEIKEKTLTELEQSILQRSREINENEGPDEAKIRMEKEVATLRIRLERKDQTLKRSQHFLDEVRLEQLKMIEDHSQEILGLQHTILEQQRALHRVEQTQREIAASAASSRAVVRHLETEADSSHQLHAQLSELAGQLETARKQAAQWKHAAECLSKEKKSFKDSLEKDHLLVIDHVKSQLEVSQSESKELREKVSDLQRQLTEERFDRQRSTLLQVLVAKLKTELDKKEKQMEYLKRLAEELHSRVDSNNQKQPEPLSTSTPVPTVTETQQPSSPRHDQLSQSLADLELRHCQLEKDFQGQRKKLDSIQSQEKKLREQLKEQNTLVEKLQDEKGTLSRTMVALRNRVTRMSNEIKATGEQTMPDDVCRLLKRIKELEAQLAMFHTAEKPAAEDQQQMLAKHQVMDQWKERKKLQSLVDHLKMKSRELQDRIQDDERQKDGLRKTINRLVNEKRVLEDKLKYKAHDTERIHRLVEDNTQWRIRFEALERQLREASEDETNTNRHRLQISVLQDRIRKQDQQIAQLLLLPSGSNKSANSTMSSDEMIIKTDFFNQIVTKLKENIQRLINLVQMPTKLSGEKRLTIQEGPPMPDIRRTAQTLHQLISKLSPGVRQPEL